MSVEWLCARCAKKEGKQVEPDPVILRLCTSCKVENWVRPCGHAGEAMDVTAEEVAEAHEKASREAKETEAAQKLLREKHREKRSKDLQEAKAEVGESIPEIDAGEDVTDTVESDDTPLDTAGEPIEQSVVSEKEAEIERLKAQLAALEGDAEE